MYKCVELILNLIFQDGGGVLFIFFIHIKHWEDTTDYIYWCTKKRPVYALLPKQQQENKKQRRNETIGYNDYGKFGLFLHNEKGQQFEINTTMLELLSFLSS